MYTYVLGPILAFFPHRWRMAIAPSDVPWSRAAAISGLLEFVLCLVGGGKWYLYSMNTWISRGWDATLNGQTGPGVTDHAIGWMALLMWANHPLTWVLAYFSVEGAVRFCGAAFGESYLGTLPLFLVEKTFLWIMGVPRKDPERPPIAVSFVNAVTERLLESQSAGADELIQRRAGSEELLEIRASRRKADWDPPRVVRIGEKYYRLEAFAKGAPPKPFRYTLRRLAAGVMSRTVLVYDTELETHDS
jgi:hypothetical protein